jgi:hypothetical protein
VSGLDVTVSLAPAQSSLLTGLVHVFLLNETSGNRSAAVGGLVLQDTNTVGYTTGKSGNAASFLKASQEQLVSTTNVVLPASYSASCWFYAVGVPASYATIIAVEDLDDQAGTTQLLVQHTSGTLWAWTADGTNLAYATNFGWGTGAWKHLVVTYDSSIQELQLYVDGTAGTPGTLPGTRTTSSQPLRLGAEDAWTSSLWNGYIDEVYIYDRVLNSTEITDLGSKYYPEFA